MPEHPHMQTTNPGGPAKTGSDRTSHSLLARATDNDPEAWERVVQLYSPMVYYWCRESGLPQSDLNDVFQEVFHTLARNLGKFRPVKNGTFRGWLRTLTRNKISDYFRKNSREPFAAGGTDAQRYFENLPATTDHVTRESNTAAIETDIQQTFLREALRHVRPHFSDQSWKAFWMVVIEGRDTSDVADELKMQPGSVRVAKFRVLKRLRKEIGDSID